jgi:dienelactone hydrolase
VRKTKLSKTKKIFISVLLAIALLIGSATIYLCDYYRADESAIAAFTPMSEIRYQTLRGGDIVFAPENAEVGLIFYPGGKVDESAYKPLAASLAARGILCVIVKMPFNLAVLDINAANGIKENYNNIERWYIGGHSLGGSMAASYLEKHSSDFDGLILLGSYSTADLRATDLAVLSIYGSNDNILNREKYEANRYNLPDSSEEFIIAGGNHAYFGMYGEQDGDGEATVTNEEQITLTADRIAKTVLAS